MEPSKSYAQKEMLKLAVIEALQDPAARKAIAKSVARGTSTGALLALIAFVLLAATPAVLLILSIKPK